MVLVLLTYHLLSLLVLGFASRYQIMTVLLFAVCLLIIVIVCHVHMRSFSEAVTGLRQWHRSSQEGRGKKEKIERGSVSAEQQLCCGLSKFPLEMLSQAPCKPGGQWTRRHRRGAAHDRGLALGGHRWGWACLRGLDLRCWWSWQQAELERGECLGFTAGFLMLPVLGTGCKPGGEPGPPRWPRRGRGLQFLLTKAHVPYRSFSRDVLVGHCRTISADLSFFFFNFPFAPFNLACDLVYPVPSICYIFPADELLIPLSSTTFFPIPCWRAEVTPRPNVGVKLQICFKILWLLPCHVWTSPHLCDSLTRASHRLWKNSLSLLVYFIKLVSLNIAFYCFLHKCMGLWCSLRHGNALWGWAPPELSVWRPSSKTSALLRISFSQSRSIHGLFFGPLAEDLTAFATLIKARMKVYG